MMDKFSLKDGRIVLIKRLTIEDYNQNNNYNYVHKWLNKINTFLALEFEKEDLQQDRANFEIIMSNKDGYIIIGALFEDKIIATASLELNQNNKKLGHIGKWGIVIHPDFQNQGLGKHLLQKIEKISKEKGLRKLEAEFFEGNVKAEKLYIEKLKYKIEGKRKFGGLLKNGNYVDRILIGKIIEKDLKI